MSTSGWIFFIGSWMAILLLNVFWIVRLINNNNRKKNRT